MSIETSTQNEPRTEDAAEILRSTDIMTEHEPEEVELNKLIRFCLDDADEHSDLDQIPGQFRWHLMNLDEETPLKRRYIAIAQRILNDKAQMQQENFKAEYTENKREKLDTIRKLGVRSIDPNVIHIPEGPSSQLPAERFV